MIGIRIRGSDIGVTLAGASQELMRLFGRSFQAILGFFDP
jgi:hypothetical protein